MPTYTLELLDWTKLDRDDRWDLSGGTPRETRIRVTRKAIAHDWLHYYEIEAPSIRDAFERLNHDHPADYKFRSPSIGDVFEDQATGKRYVVAPIGFEEL